MIWMKAIGQGIWGGRGKALQAGLLYGLSLLAGGLALAPLASGLHRVLDESPVAAEMLRGQGLDLVMELGHNQPGLFGAAFGTLGWAVAILLAAGFFLTAGIFAVASEGAESPWREFWPKAARRFLPFLAITLLNLLLWAVPVIVVGLAIFGIGRAFEDAMDPGVSWRLFWVNLTVAGLTLNAVRTGSGLGRAWYGLTGGRDGVGKSALRGFVLSLKRIVPANLITWVFNALRGVTLVAAAWWLSPGWTTSGKAFLTGLLLQAGFFVAAFWRVAEIRSWVEYTRAFVPTPAATEVPFTLAVTPASPAATEVGGEDDTAPEPAPAE